MFLNPILLAGIKSFALYTNIKTIEIMANTIKRNNTVILIITTFFLLVSMVCLIINYAIDREITWSLYPIGGLIVIYATIIPLLILKKNRTSALFIGLTLTLIPYVFLIQHLVEVKGWFMPLAMPILILSLIAFGITLIALNSKKLNTFYAIATAIFLFGVVVNIGVGLLVYRFLDEVYQFDIFRVTTISLCVLLSLVFLLMGYFKK